MYFLNFISYNCGNMDNIYSCMYIFVSFSDNHIYIYLNLKLHLCIKILQTISDK